MFVGVAGVRGILRVIQKPLIELSTSCVVQNTREKSLTEKPRWKTNLVRELSYPAMDHARSMGHYLIAHPYTLGLPDLRKLLDACEKRNLELVISGTSEYFPAHTLKISICKRNVPKGVLLHMHDTFEGEQRGE